MLLINKQGNGLTILKEVNGSNVIEKKKVAAVSDLNLDTIESDASVVVEGITSASKLTFFNGEKYRYLWVQEALNQIQIGQYAGTAASLDITAVSAIADIEVDNATVIGNVPLPTKVEVTISSQVKVFLPVVWDDGTPDYDGATAGTYTFAGTITLPSGLLNTGTLKASVDVVVAEAEGGE